MAFFFFNFRWLELNKQSGYDRVLLYNQSIDNRDQSFTKLFSSAAYKNYALVKHLQCLPDFDPETSVYQKYKRTNRDLKFDGKQFALMSDVFNIIVLSECYLNNIDKWTKLSIYRLKFLCFLSNYEKIFKLHESGLKWSWFQIRSQIGNIQHWSWDERSCSLLRLFAFWVTYSIIN